MRILIEIPTWLGDAVMTTPAIENIVARYPDAVFILFGSFVATRVFLEHPRVTRVIVDDSKQGGNRYLNLYRLAKSVGSVDMALSFRRNITTRFFLWFVDTPKRYIYRRYTKQALHQVIRYNDFVKRSLDIECDAKGLKIYTQGQKREQGEKPLLGLNPGATYGAAKRWYPEAFAEVAIALSKRYNILIFGGKAEVDIAQDIETALREAESSVNFKNLAGQTSVEELIETIATLDLFITNDSGPMHVAAAFSVATVAIFGPTRHVETHQWMNPKEILIRKEMACSPCMKRVCPLRHHECMKLITAEDVLDRLARAVYI